MREIRNWQGPVAVESQIANLAAFAGAAGYPNGPKKPLVGIVGPYAHCDVWVTAPTNWSDVTFRFLGKINDSWVELDVRTLADIEHAVRLASGISGILFTVRGRVCTEFGVEAFFTTTNHSGSASFNMIAWGHEAALVGDRAGHAVAQPFALPHQQWSTNGILGAPGGILPVAPFHPAGGRLYVTRVSITNNDPVAQRMQLNSVTPAGASTTQDDWRSNASALVENFTYPQRMPLGERLEIVIAAISAGALFSINATGYFE